MGLEFYQIDLTFQNNSVKRPWFVVPGIPVTTQASLGFSLDRKPHRVWFSTANPLKRSLQSLWGHICYLLHKCGLAGKLKEDEQFEACFMSRISIDVTSEEHQKLKAMAALQGKSIKDYVIERTLGAEGDKSQEAALEELESLLDERMRGAQNGSRSQRTVGAIFQDAYRASKSR